MRTTFVEVLLKNARKDKTINLVTGDLGFGVLKPLIEELPEQFVNAGIAEQNMMSMAGGMAYMGLRPIVYSIGNFPTLRCYEQIRNDVCYYNADVKIVCIGGGFTYGALGMSHHATEDIALMRAMPNMHVFAPSDRLEAQVIIDKMFELKSPAYLRLERDSAENLHADKTKFILGAPAEMKLHKETNSAIFSYGTIAKTAKLVGEHLKIDSYSVPCLKPIDEEKFVKTLKKYEKIYSLEEHNIIGGLSSIISDLIARYNLNVKFVPFAINDILCSAVGSQDYLRKVNGLDFDSLVSKIEKVSK